MRRRPTAAAPVRPFSRTLAILLATGFSLLLFSISLTWFDLMPQLDLDAESVIQSYAHQKAQFSTKSYMKLIDKADFYTAKGEHEAAIQVLKQLFTLQSEIFGPEDAKTVQILELLADKTILVQKYDEGLALLWQLYKVKEKVLGPTHSDTLQTLQIIAQVYYSKKNYWKAQGFYKVVYKHRKKILGAEDLKTVDALFLMGESLLKANPHPSFETKEKVLKYYQKVHKVYHRILGEGEGEGENDRTLSVLVEMGRVLNSLERYEEALPLLRTVMKATEETPQSNLYETTEHLLSFALRQLGRTEEARQLHKTARRIKDKKGREIHELGYDSKIQVAGEFTFQVVDQINAVLNLARVAMAERNFENALEKLEQVHSILGNNHTEAPEIIYRLMIVYGGLGNFKKAFKMSTEYFKVLQKILDAGGSNYKEKIIHAWEVVFFFYIDIVGEDEEEEELYRPKLEEISDMLVKELELELEQELEFKKGAQENPYILKTVVMTAFLSGRQELALSTTAKLLEILKRSTVQEAQPKQSGEKREMEKINGDIHLFQKMLEEKQFCTAAKDCEIPRHMQELQLVV